MSSSLSRLGSVPTVLLGFGAAREAGVCFCACICSSVKTSSFFTSSNFIICLPGTLHRYAQQQTAQQSQPHKPSARCLQAVCISTGCRLTVQLLVNPTACVRGNDAYATAKRRKQWQGDFMRQMPSSHSVAQRHATVIVPYRTYTPQGCRSYTPLVPLNKSSNGTLVSQAQPTCKISTWEDQSMHMVLRDDMGQMAHVDKVLPWEEDGHMAPACAELCSAADQ
jgi:hypothetical protein